MAGGLNLYGYGDGDPINNSDPLGLCPICAVYAAFEIGSSLYDAVDLAVTGARYLNGTASGAELAVTAAGAGAGLVGFGGGYGRAGRAAVEAGLRGVANVAEQAAFKSLANGVGAGKGVVIAGAGSGAAHRNAAAFAQRYGGEAGNYVKKSTTRSVTTEGGSKAHQIGWRTRRLAQFTT